MTEIEVGEIVCLNKDVNTDVNIVFMRSCVANQISLLIGLPLLPSSVFPYSFTGDADSVEYMTVRAIRLCDEY